jgi:hypothetical protein
MIYVMVFTTAIKTRHSPLEFILEFRWFYCLSYYCSRSVNCRNANFTWHILWFFSYLESEILTVFTVTVLLLVQVILISSR